MKTRRTYQVREVASIARVSVRALHHYDAIGLLAPSDRTEAGYRLYTDEDLLRLQQVLIGRELGLALEDIKKMLDDPGFDRRDALERQRAALVAKLDSTTAMIRAIDTALIAIQQEEETVEMKELFDGFDPSQYEDEAKERWGDTDAYKESARRTRSYTKEDWQRYKDENDGIMKDAVALMQAGRGPEDEEAMDVAERHRLSIDRWFYPCSKEMHAGLANMYEADARFAQNIDKYAEGLTPWWSAAIRANAGR